VPSSQQPPAGGTALDPTAVRPPIGDARIMRATPATVRAMLEGLKADGFNMLVDIGGADYPGREGSRFDVVYHLMRLPRGQSDQAAIGTPQRVRILCAVAEDAALVPTVSDLWPAADWAEREIFDLFGISFSGHPDLRRIQLPDDWEGYPLRKDYPLRGPARERAPRPSFALKSNVAAGTPASGRTAAALQKQIAETRARNVPNAADQTAAAQSAVHPGGGATAGDAKPSDLAQQPINTKTDDGKPRA